MIEKIIYAIVSIVFLLWGLLPLIIYFSFKKNLDQMIAYLKQKKPQVYGKLTCSIPPLKKRTNVLVFPMIKPISFLSYMLSDSEDDDKSLSYKRRYQFLVLGFVFYFVIMWIIFKLA